MPQMDAQSVSLVLSLPAALSLHVRHRIVPLGRLPQVTASVCCVYLAIIRPVMTQLSVRHKSVQ